MENLNNKKSDAASMCDTGALSRPTDATNAADAEADSLESGCSERFQSNFGNCSEQTLILENSGHDDERQNDPGSNRASGNRSRTNCIHLTKASEMTLMLIKITSMQCGNKTRVTVHFAADKRLCDSPPRVDMK